MKTFVDRIKERARTYSEKYECWEDKVQGRYIAEQLGVPIPRTHAILDNAADIDFNRLPSKYVIKVNHWAACYGVLAIQENYDLVHKKAMTNEEIRAYIGKFMKKQFTMEKSQSLIRRKILIEEFLYPENSADKLPTDYKCFVFGGKCHYIQVVRNRANGKVVHDFMTPAWKKVRPPMVDDYFQHGKDMPLRPKCLPDIIKRAELLGADFGEFIRVDIFATTKGAIFGEFTVQPASGDYFSEYGNKQLTRLWDEYYPDKPVKKTKKKKRRKYKLCITTVVDGYYQLYIPMFIYCAKKSYPDYYVKVFFRGTLNPPVWDCLKDIEDAGIDGWEVKENWFTDYPYQLKTSACLRYLLPPEEVKDFEYVHINDADMLIMREKPSILEYHRKRIKKEGWLYSNTKGTWDHPFNGLARRLPALPTFTKKWYSKIEPIAKKYRKLLKAGEVGLINCYDEIMLFKLVEQSGQPLPEKYDYEVKYHGLHLGMAKMRGKHSFTREKVWWDFFEARTKNTFIPQYLKLLKDPVFSKFKTLACTKQEIAGEFNNLGVYISKTGKKIYEPATLALNIIVGPNESIELERCLKSTVVPGVYDEVVIGVNTNDAKVMDVAKKYATKIVTFVWENNYAKGRNIVMSETASDYIMWLDADDEMPRQWRKDSRVIKKKVSAEQHKIDIWIMNYNTVIQGGNVIASNHVIRIFRNDKKYAWQHPIHERPQYSLAQKKHGFIRNISVNHLPLKAPQAGLARNLWILRTEYDKYPNNMHLKYYLMRDLLAAGEISDGMALLDDMINKKQGNPVNIANACNQVALNLAYKKHAKYQYSINADNAETAKKYAAISVQLSDAFAEPWVVIGDIAEYEGNTDIAISAFKTAMLKRVGSFGVQRISFYREVPALRLCLIYADQGNHELFLIFANIVLQYQPDNKPLKKLRNVALTEMRKKYAGRPVR